MDGRVNVVDISLGKVSVVQIERAVVNQALWSLLRFAWPVGILDKIFCMGSLWLC